MKFADRVAVVTGAGGAMGGAVARELARGGARLAINDISARRLEQTAADLTAGGTDVVALRGDVGQRAEAEALVGAALSRFGRIDILVNVVGGVKGEVYKPFLDLTDAEWDATVQLNLKPTFLLTQLVGRVMMDQRYGRIVNFASTSYGGSKGQAHYSAGKAGVVAFTRTVAWELAPYVAVNCVAPGLVRTSVTDRLDQATQQALVAGIPQGRMGDPAEVARVVAFLASDDASHVTGEVLMVSGGVAVGL